MPDPAPTTTILHRPSLIRPTLLAAPCCRSTIEWPTVRTTVNNSGLPDNHAGDRLAGLQPSSRRGATADQLLEWRAADPRAGMEFVPTSVHQDSGSVICAYLRLPVPSLRALRRDPTDGRRQCTGGMPNMWSRRPPHFRRAGTAGTGSGFAEWARRR